MAKATEVLERAPVLRSACRRSSAANRSVSSMCLGGDRGDQDSVESMMNILDHVSIRLPCNQCGQTYEVPLSDVLLSHAVVRCGCPAPQETECPPVFQIRLFDLEPIRALSLAWEQLAKRADSDGGELVFSAPKCQLTENDIAGTTREQLQMQHAEHTKDGRIRQPVPTFGLC